MNEDWNDGAENTAHLLQKGKEVEDVLNAKMQEIAASSSQTEEPKNQVSKPDSRPAGRPRNIKPWENDERFQGSNGVTPIVTPENVEALAEQNRREIAEVHPELNLIQTSQNSTQVQPMFEKNAKTKLNQLMSKLEVIVDKGFIQVTSKNSKEINPHALTGFIQHYIKVIELLREVELEESGELDIGAVISAAPYDLKVQFQELWTKMIMHYQKVMR